MENDEAAQLARSVLALRRKRYEHLPQDLFGEHAWGILLAMFVADAEGKRVTGGDVFASAGCTSASGRRWMAALMEYDLVVGQGPRDDVDIVSLTPSGIHAVERCMQDAQALMGVRKLGKTEATE